MTSTTTAASYGKSVKEFWHALLLSFEGLRNDTDQRRGSGVNDRLLLTGSRLKDRNIFFGCSVTTTRKNFELVTGEASSGR
jgi:hypothetical protein